MRKPAQVAISLLPWLGLGSVLAGGVAYFVTGSFGLATNLLLTAGAASLLLFAFLRPGELRHFVAGRQARYGLSTTLSILFMVAIGTLVYWIAYQNSDWRIDTTAANDLTPLPETASLLKQLDGPVHVIGFYTLRSVALQDMARPVLESLRAVNDRLSYEFVDPNADPLLAEQYDLSNDATLVFVKGEGVEQVVSKSISTNDRDLYTALLQVVNPREKRVYLVEGHGERDAADSGPNGVSNAVADLERLGFVVEPLNLAVSGEVPEDADVLALIDQRSPLQAAEVAAIGRYLATGGAAFIARDVVTDEPRQRVEADGLIAELAESWGIILRNDLVVEPELGLAGQIVPLQFVSFDFGSGPIADAELRSLGALFDIARTVDHVDDPDAQRVYADLALTSQSAWGETNFLDPPQPDETDSSGPLVIGVSMEDLQSGTRLVVFGDTDFARNDLIYLGGNSLLLSNAVNWLAGDDVALALTPRENVQRQVVITENQLVPLQAVGCLLGPGLMAFVGLLTWYNRRKRR